MTSVRECATELFALLQPLLEPEGYTRPSKARWFARRLGPGVEGRVGVSVITYRSGGFTASFPTGIRFEAVEQVRNRFRRWPPLLSEKQIQELQKTVHSVARAYPKELGAAAAVHLDSPEQVRTAGGRVEPIVRLGLRWIDRFRDLEEVRRTLESESPADWPVALPDQRDETLLAIYAVQQDVEALAGYSERVLARPRRPGDDAIRAYTTDVRHEFVPAR